MWNLNKSIIVVVFIGRMISCLLATTISLNPKNFEQNLSLNFEESMDKCDTQQQEIVKLNNTNLMTVTDNFIVSDHVDSIILENNTISYISPKAFESVPNLSCLNIRWNNLTDIFYYFLPSFTHKSLKKLNLAHTAFDRYTKTYEYLYGSVSSKGFLPNVTHLDISDNNLDVLPSYLETLFPRLTHLYLSDNKIYSDYLKRIPATTQYLYLERNGYEVDITSFPRNISALFLSKNNLVQNYYINSYPNLRILSIKECNTLSEVFPYLDNGKLVDLDISSNDLSVIHADLFKNPKSLQRLSLDRNSLDSILFLESFVSLTDLSIAYNKLVNITSNLFTNTKNLKKLNLRGNRIALIDKDAFLNLKMLEKLDLAENRLTKLPDSWMNTLTGLRYLNLQSNLFSSIDYMHINARIPLNYLFLGNNNITKIEMASLRNLPSTVNVFPEYMIKYNIPE
ncbi:PREDICTED: leucine-rich repeat-containing protein let-4-like [Polistes dominula]|uniref:Leucine-rich repeat-containing protein let-4-like n=1 Tax=Polistes dominula TaxID=743375 RepID=A0ABM1IK19_POLDO|nr:PREDICTED: leucine-rich repeat-containing protein let-4-like [Polistes dominula]